jgi:hypothetical protein
MVRGALRHGARATSWNEQIDRLAMTKGKADPVILDTEEVTVGCYRIVIEELVRC